MTSNGLWKRRPWIGGQRAFALVWWLAPAIRAVNWASNTKGQAMILARHLEERIALDQPLNIHLTGCPHSCAQHYIGDIGLLATQVEKDDDLVEGYHIHIGGGYGDAQAVGEEVFSSVAFEDLPPLIEHMLTAYLGRHKSSDESFIDFAKRHSADRWREMVELSKVAV